YVMRLDQLPLARVVNDAKVDDHHAIIPTDVPHNVESFSPDERRIFDLVSRRFLAVFHPPARYARTTIVTEVEGESFRTRGKVTLEAGWRGVYGLEADDPAAERPVRASGPGEGVSGEPGGSPGPDETEDAELPELQEHKITSPELTGEWEHKLSEIEHGRGDRRSFMQEIETFAGEIVGQIEALDKEKLRPERVELGPCPRCGAETGEIIKENSRAYGCTSWKSREEPGCGYVIWKRVAGRTITPEIARQLIENGRTTEVLSGFRSKAGKPFRARLVLNGDGKTEFEFPARTQAVQPTAAE